MTINVLAPDLVPTLVVDTEEEISTEKTGIEIEKEIEIETAVITGTPE